jgi:phage terminase small subunit
MRELKQMGIDNHKPDGTTQYLTIETERGWVKNPLVTVLDTAAKQIRSLGAELGLTSDLFAIRLHPTPEDPADPLREFLNRKPNRLPQ